MRVSIIDNGLRQKAGHHFDYCMRITQELLKRGISVSLFGHRSVQTPVMEAFSALRCSVWPAFRSFPYSPRLAPEDNTWDCIKEICAQAREDMLAIMQIDLAPPDLMLFPTLDTVQFVAYANLDQAPVSVGMVHDAPAFQFDYGGEAWAHAAERITAASRPALIGAIDPLIGWDYKTFSGELPIIDMPVPQDGIAKPSYAPAVRKIGFFGFQRPERGSFVIPKLIENLLAREFEVVLHDSSKTFNPQGRLPPRLKFLDHVDDLSAEIAKCDLVVCPMMPGSYRFVLSGIVMDAIATGVPIVLPAGTLPAMRVQEIGAGSFYYSYSVDSILDAVNRAVHAYSRLAVAAQRGAVRWREANGTGRFVDFALSHAAQHALQPS